MNNKIKLIENFSVEPDEYKKKDFSELTESDQILNIKESGKEKKYKSEAIYTFPISRPGQKNLNERIYPVKLWEKVIKEQQGFGNYGLMDHPEKEGSTKDAFCVWRNVRFSEDKKLVLADAYLFGPWGRQVKEALEAGGKIGLSTSGFGEFEKDEMTVKADSYELERVADHVLNPSYAVFGEQDNIAEKTEKKEAADPDEMMHCPTGGWKGKRSELDNGKCPECGKSVEPLKKDEDFKKDETIIIIKEKAGENKMADKKMTSFEEKSFRLNIESRLKEFSKIENVAERVSKYEDLLQYFDEGIAVDLKESLDEKIKADKAEILELAEKGSKVELIVESSKKDLLEKIDILEKDKKDLDVTIESLVSKYDKATELLDSIKVYSNKMKEMYEVAIAEKNGMISASEYKEALVYIEDLENEKEELKDSVKYYKQKALKEKKTLEKKTCKKEEEPEEDDEEEPEEKEVEIEEDYSKYKAPSEVISYYEDLVYATPAIVKIKEDILSCRTLMEAQRTYLRLKSLIYIEEDHERRPSVSKSAFFENKKEEVKKPYIGSTKLVREGWM